MTYIDYLNAFHQWLESNTLPVNSQLMFFKLLNVFNRAGWPEQVRVDTLRLMMMVDTADKKTAYRARDKLVDAGLLKIYKGKKHCPTSYSLTFCGKKPTETATVSATLNATVSATVSDTENATHIKTKTKNKTKTDLSVSEETDRNTDVQRIVDAWNSIGTAQITKLTADTVRYKMLKCRIRDYGVDGVLKAIENVKTSDFLLGKTGKGTFQISFDWFVKPNNFVKVLEGNYANRGGRDDEFCGDNSGGESSKWNIEAIIL